MAINRHCNVDEDSSLSTNLPFTTMLLFTLLSSSLGVFYVATSHNRICFLFCSGGVLNHERIQGYEPPCNGAIRRRWPVFSKLLPRDLIYYAKEREKKFYYRFLHRSIIDTLHSGYKNTGAAFMATKRNVNLFRLFLVPIQIIKY